MRIAHVLAGLAALTLAGSAQAAVKVFDASKNNGTPGDLISSGQTTCPPVMTTPGALQGFAQLEDDGLGTVTMQDINISIPLVADYGPDLLTQAYGPGAFFFLTQSSTTSITGPHVSTTGGIGAHGPSGTAPGETAEWGIVSGWTISGYVYCASSPTALCGNNGFQHAATISSTQLPSTTFDLGTWSFDAEGDYTGHPYIARTTTGGLVNVRYAVRGSFVGASLPALPFVGFGALALGLAVIGGRAVRGKK
jgi:hypothetical protein